MNDPSANLPPRTGRFRLAITAFIAERREAKLKGKEDDTDAASKYDYATWLADAARRVGQIQAVTHVLKATHPDARGTSLHVSPRDLPPREEIGTHTLGENYAEDVVGNAAALDVFKFLKIEVDGRRLLDWMRAGDADLAHALHPDAPTASGWMRAFGNLVRDAAAPVSHQAAKQVYWLVGEEATDDADYHLLQPVFSSSLAHAVHTDIQDARFGEANKQAREARREKKPHDQPYRTYVNLVARKMGGTKPQNISQLNSERGGVNYLLASLPPRWKPERPLSLLHIKSSMERFAQFQSVRPLLKELADFLRSDPPANMATRIRRESMEQALGAYLPAFAEAVHATQKPGWTLDPDCKLEWCEQLWLDPGRLEQDSMFKAAYDWGDWPDEVAGRFANWVKNQLIAAGLTTVGDDAEYRHWARQAIIDAAWPVPMQRRAPAQEAREAQHE